MKKYIYILFMLSLIVLTTFLTPRESEEISAYQDSDSHLLMPQKNVVIATLNLPKNNLKLNSTGTLDKLNVLNDEFLQMDGVNSVNSILNATVIYSYEDEIEVSSFISDGITESELTEQLASMSEYPELQQFVNSDSTSLLFYIYFSYSAKSADILASMEKVAENSELTFSFTGKSPIFAITERLLSKDILVFLPILIILVMVIFLTFRSFKAIAAAWTIILLSVGAAFSLIGYLGVELTPLVLLVPVFSLGLLSDYIIHFIYHLFYEPSAHDSFRIRRSLIYPLGLTAISTLTGFISLIYINASGHVLLGGIIAISVLLTFTGVVLWLPYLKLNRPGRELMPAFSRNQTKLFVKLFKYRHILYGILIVGIIWGIIKLPDLRTEPYPIEQLPETTTVRKAENLINDDFFGSLPFFIEINGGEANSFLQKDTLLRLEKIHNELNSSKEVGYSYSLLTVLKRINYYFMGDEESLLESTEYDDFYDALIEQYLIYYTSGVDPLEYESMVDPSYRFFSIKGYLKYDSVESLDGFYKTVEEIKETLPENWTMEIHGVVKSLKAEKNGLTRNWIFSFAVGSFMIFITVLLFYKKLNLALLSLIPGFISMILSFGIISTMGVKIDSFSIIFVAIITGLVIDYSIHTLSAIDKIKSIKTIAEGFSYINSYSGIPIFLSFLTSLFSFSVLFLSSFSGARSLGLLLFASLIISYVLSLYLLPIIILPKKIKK